MKKISVIFFFFFVSKLVFSQHKEHIEWSENQLKFSPLRIVNWFTPGFELSYQRNYGNFASQVSIAYLTDIIKFREDVQGYRLSFEQKYYFPKSYFKYQRTFISFSNAYNNISSTRSSQLFVPKDNQWDDYTNSYIDDNKINRQSVTFNVKIGMEFQVKRLLLEWGAGIGIAYHNVRQLNKKSPDYRIEYGLLSPMFEKEGKKVMPNIPITFKIGYAF